jgi:hypothetical protein
LLILENESHFFKLDTPAAILIYGHGIDMDEVLKIQQKWFDVRKNLVDLAGKILGTDQESDEFENSINNWLGVLEQFSHVSGEINSKLALKALDNLREFFK